MIGVAEVVDVGQHRAGDERAVDAAHARAVRAMIAAADERERQNSEAGDGRAVHPPGHLTAARAIALWATLAMARRGDAARARSSRTRGLAIGRVRVVGIAAM